MVCIFIAQFINTGISPILSNANFRYAPWPFNKIPLNMAYTDMTSTWYEVVGPALVYSVFIQAIFPYVGALMMVATTEPFRWLDSGCLCCKRRKQAHFDNKTKSQLEAAQEENKEYKDTKLTNMFDYLELYQGPEFLLNYSYASICLLIYLTFIYGLVFPIVFPICAFFFVNI